jgi:hypothetical protein
MDSELNILHYTTRKKTKTKLAVCWFVYSFDAHLRPPTQSSADPYVVLALLFMTP